MNVREFAKWLETQDQDATVYVQVQQEARPFAPYGECIETPFDPEKHADYCDPRTWRKDPNAERTITFGTSS